MAVYRRGYDRYQGPITGRLSRLLVLPKYSWRRVLQQRMVVSLLVGAMFYPLGCIGFVYLSNHAELLLDFGSEMKGFLQIDGNFFLIFMNVQGVFAILLTIISGQSPAFPRGVCSCPHAGAVGPALSDHMDSRCSNIFSAIGNGWLELVCTKLEPRIRCFHRFAAVDPAHQFDYIDLLGLYTQEDNGRSVDTRCLFRLKCSGENLQ